MSFLSWIDMQGLCWNKEKTKNGKQKRKKRAKKERKKGKTIFKKKLELRAIELNYLIETSKTFFSPLG